MSTTIDQRVVEMRFDNKQFENATKTTMSTLDKLKQKLNLTGASKGLQEVNHAAKKVDMSGLGSAVESVGKKFSVMEVMGVTALVNLTNQAVNAGKRIISALTIEPVSTGFKEYELKLDSVRTIMASTGESIDTVNGYLEELNKYSDQTIYSFADMTQNIGKFTNAGVKLEDAVLAIKGISNEAAVSGANANEAARAMYNLAQALSIGYVQRIDWKSIELANMGTMEFKNQLLDAAVAMGTVTKNAEGMYATLEHPDEFYNTAAMFTETLDDQWLTTEVLISTLKDYADETTDIGKKAFAAAQEVTKFTQMLDVLKETAQSGWAKTWELMFGDLLEAKSIFTPLTNFFSNIINKMSDWRNKIIEGAMGSPLIGAYVKIIENLNGKAKTMRGVLDNAANAMDNFGKIVDRVMSGEFGNGQARWDKLTEAGYNWAEVQNKVNEKMDSSVRHATELGEAHGKLVESEEEAQEARAKTIEQMIEMSDKELKDIGLKQQEINALRELEKQSEKTGIPVKELAKDLSLLNGRTLLINSFKNIGNALVKTFTAMKLAWQDIFDPITSEHLYDAIAGFHKLTTHLHMDAETVDKLTRTFKGLFAILDIILTLTAGPLKIAFKVLTSLLGALDLDILDVTAAIGDALVNFRDWIDEVVNFDKIFEIIAPAIKSAAGAIRDWINTNIDLTAALKKVTDFLGPAKDAISNWIDGLKNAEDVQQYIIDTIIGAIIKVKEYIGRAFKNLGTTMSQGMDNALEAMLVGWDSIPTDIAAGFEKGFLVGIASILKNVRSFCKKFIDTVKRLFGIHSPSRVMYEIGQNVIQGFINGIVGLYNAVISAVKNLFTGARDTIIEVDFTKPLDAIIESVKKFGSKVAEVFSGIDFGKIFAAALGVGMLVIAKKAIDVLEMFGKPLEGFGDLLSGIGEAAEGFGKNLKATAFKKNAQALLIMSGAILILVMAILPLTELSWEQLAKAGLSIAALAGIMIAMAKLLDNMGKVDEGGKIKSSVASAGKLLVLSGSLFLVAFAIKKLSEVGIDGSVKDTIVMLAAAVGSLALLMIAFGKFISVDKAANMDKAGMMIFKMAAALLTITTVIKIVSGFTYSDITKGLTFILGVGLLFTAITVVSKFSGEHADKAGSMLWRMSIAMLMMAGVVKIAAGFSGEEIKKGLAFVAGVEILFAGLIALSHLSGENAKKAGKMIFSMGIAMLAVVFAVKLVAGMDAEDIKKGLGVVSALMILFAGVVAVSHFAGEHALKAGIMLLAMSIALGLMVGITFIVSKLDPKEMWKGLAFVAALEAMMAGLIAVTKYSKATKQLNATLTRFIIIIALMVAAVIGLSFIDPKNLAAATGALSGVMGMFAAMMFATKYTKNTKHMRKSLIALLGVTMVLAGIIAALSLLNPDSALKSASSLSMLLLAFSSSIFILGKAGRVSKTAIDALKPMLIIAAGLTGILAVFGVLNKFGLEPSIQSAVALGILLNAFSASIVILGKVGSGVINALPIIKPMSIIVAELAGILGLLALLNVEASIPSAIALGILLNAFAASIVVLGMTGPNVYKALPALQPMALVMFELAGILGLMALVDVEASIPSAIALGILVNALAASIVILSMAGWVSNDALIAAMVMGLVIAELALSMGIMASMNVDSAIPYAISLGILLTALTVGIGILGFIAPLIPAAIPAVIGLGVVIAEIAILLAAIGGLAQIPGLEWLISEGGVLLQTIGTALGQFVGGIIGGIAEGAASALPEIAKSLSGFMTNIQPFITGAQSIDSSVLTGVACLAGAILLLTAADLLAGIATFAGLSFVDLGTQLSGFIMAAMPFITNIQMIDPASVEAAKTLAEMILILTAAELISGITSFIGGSTDFSTFGTQLQSFGTAICAFSNTLTANGGINEEAVTAAANAGKLIAGLQNELYGTGGIKQDLFGEKDLSTFGVQLSAFGTAICTFSNTLTKNGGIDSEAVESAVKAGELIAGLQNALYGAGGLKQDIFGEKDLSLFGIQLRSFGSAICGFSNTLKTNGGIDSEAVESAAKAGETMAALQNSIEAAGGLKTEIFGDKNLADFGAQIKLFGEAMVSFSETVSGKINEDAVMAASNAGRVMAEVQAAIPEDKWFDGKMSLDDFGKKIAKFGEGIVGYSEEVVDVDQEAVSKSITSANRLANLAKSIVELDTSGIEAFKDVKSIGSTLKTYSEKVVETNSDAITTSISNVKKLINLIGNMAKLDTSGVSSFKSAIESLSNIDLSGLGETVGDVSKFTAIGGQIVDAIVNGIVTKQVNMSAVGNTLVGYLVTGISSKRPAVITATAALISDMIININAKQEVFFTTGILLMSKLNSGVLSRSGSLKASVGSAVSNAASTIRGYYGSFYNAGRYLVDGFIDGISSKIDSAAKKAASMAAAAVKAAEKELDINSPSRVFRTIGEYTVEGFVMGIDRLAYMVRNSAGNMADTAINSVSNSIARIAEAVNTDIDTQPTIRPVLDLSDVRSGASSINGLFDMSPTVGVMANANSIGSMMNSRQNGVGTGDVVSAINKLRDGLNNIGNTNYNVNGITYSNGSEVAEAVRVLTHAALVEGRI